MLVLIALISAILLTGCWNYREVNKLAIVAGVAIDKGIKNKIQMSVEIIRISDGKDTKATSKTLTMEGKALVRSETYKTADF